MLAVGAHIEKYEVLELLGEGGMATVYKVQHEHLGSFHALKVLRPELVARRDIRDRFLDEGRIQAQMRHPNIVPVTDIVAAPGIAGLVAQFVDGPSLESHIESSEGLPSLADVKDIFGPLLAGLGYAHDQGVVHRDIKPANILLSRRKTTSSSEVLATRYVPMILDFGIAKVRGALDGSEERKRTRAGARMGTLDYMSPEQVHGEEDLDQRADIFALSATLYEFVTGKVPFGAESEYDTMRKIVQGETDPIQELVPNVHPLLDALIRKGLSTEREDRFATCAEMAVALKSITWQRTAAPSSQGSVAPRQMSEPPPPAAPTPAAVPAVQAQSSAAAVAPEAEGMIHGPPAIPGLLAALLNFFCLPGLGHMCLGQGAKGVTLLFGTAVAALCSGGATFFFSQVFIAVDAYAIGKKLSEGESVGAWEWF